MSQGPNQRRTELPSEPPARPEDDAADSGGPVEGTRMESVEEIRQATGVLRTPTLKEATGSDTMPFRPLQRPPLALLCVLDDGKDDGEWVRIRRSPFVIGRVEGDLVIPHDSLISGRHAELSQRVEKGRYRWHLTDLRSSNGTYVRLSRALLRHGSELLLGSRRYRFDGPAGEQAVISEGAPPQGTRGWREPAVGSAPSLVELTPRGDGQRYLLPAEENWLGRDPTQATVVLANDPLVSPRHARLARDAKGRWMLENARSLNGTWIRQERIAIDGAGQFQLGEQRFLIKLL